MNSFVTLFGLAAAVGAANIDIDVGKTGISFSPNSVTAVAGDSLLFHFYDGTSPHSVVSSTFDAPCVPNTGAFFSGYEAGSSNGDTTFVVNVTNTDPIWFYCSAQKHCQGGMVGVVNPPSDQTIDSYAKAAQGVAAASAPDSLTGGVITTIDAAASSTTSAPSSSGTSTPASSSASTTGSVSSALSSVSSAISSASSAASSQASSAAASSTSSAAAAATGAVHNGVKIGMGAVLGGMVALMA